MKIYQSRTFGNKVKKLSKQEKEILDDEIKKIAGRSQSSLCSQVQNKISSVSSFIQKD
jgi:hypothetical protein